MTPSRLGLRVNFPSNDAKLASTLISTIAKTLKQRPIPSDCFTCTIYFNDIAPDAVPSLSVARKKICKSPAMLQTSSNVAKNFDFTKNDFTPFNKM